MKIFHSFASLPAFAALLFLFGCDVIDGPKKDYSTLQNGSDRVVVLEDFTGHKCGNCPSAQTIAKDLDSLYGEKLIVVAVHAGGFADTNTAGTKYRYNFKTPAGDTWNTDFGFSSYPKGLINRAPYSGNVLVDAADWSSAVAAMLATRPGYKITGTVTYDSTTGNGNANIKVEFLQAPTGNERLTVLITEDSIVNWQKDYRLPSGSQDVSNYVHNHVMRGSLNGTYGESISTGATLGSVIERNIPFSKGSDWVMKHCHIVAYVNDGTTREILQGWEKHVE